ncbi:MAG: hypothetical protein FJZ43_02960 [Candidatus Staskawiczbacteria bacterium]|nr:hypothetical protein [Candidatus Staskawiczbacteria bacterium]
MKKFFFSVVVALVLAQTEAVAQYKPPAPPSWMTNPSSGKSVPSNGPFIKEADLVRKTEKIETPEEKREREVKRRLEAMVASTKGQMEALLYVEVFRRQKQLLETRKGEQLRLGQTRLKRFEADKKLDIDLHLIALKQYFRAQVERDMAQMELIRMDADRKRELRELQR